MSQSTCLDIPIAFFIFKRAEKSVQIIRQIAKIKPLRLYLISDQGRNAEEITQVEECRRAVEACIDWDCEIVKNYADQNMGCFDRIGLGALWVLSLEKKAIFLEDDNYPDLSFFPYCERMLEKYEEDDDVLWICGTNYLGQYNTKDECDYVFSQHMFPCGWASWTHKFVRYYDSYFSNLNEQSVSRIKCEYKSKRLFRKDVKNWYMELDNLKSKGRFCSWDYQMCFSIRYHNKIGIVPRVNLIKNIGVDNSSAHGGTSFSSEMTKRFCGMELYSLTFPMKEAHKVVIDDEFERLTDRIVIPPIRVRTSIYLLIRRKLHIPDGVRVSTYLLSRGK